ncbi:MAG: tripartite tricarboxylate transporter substrate binding protein [Proteobacteria bacterium]|nr:tripartite tricarboxylate transporter substrate binding protein [Pseudomonadota bacterium]
MTCKDKAQLPDYTRRRLLALAAGAVAAGPLYAQSPGFATRPVRIIVPFAAGGATDVITRVLSEHMAKRFGQAVVVDNKPGGGGVIAGEAVTKAAPDGMTVMLGTTSVMLSNRYIFKRMPYDPLTDLTPLVRVCLAPIALVVTADVPAKNMQEYMSWIGANKSRLSYGSYGIGSHGQLACATLSDIAGADMSHVAYKGEAPMIADLLGGQIKMGMGSLLSLKAHIDSGRLRALAVTGPRRVPLLPDIPTFAEAGFKQDALSIVGWLAIAAPKALPAEVARQWAAAANQAVASRDGMARIIAAGFIPVDDDTPEKFARAWAAEGPIWGGLLQAAGVQPT